MPVVQDSIEEGRLTFAFPEGSLASKYDAWSHYRNQFQNVCGGAKAVDVVYVAPDVSWLIEVKDYRVNPRTKAIDLADEVAAKVRDTLAGLVSASCYANNDEERRVARTLIRRRRLRVVLHLEQPAKHSRLRPRAVEPDKVLQKLKSLLKAIDPHPAVVNQTTLKPGMAWTVAG